MVGLQGNVVCACVCLKFSSSFLLGTLLPLYVYIRTYTFVPLRELPQRLADTLFHRKSSFCCAECCMLVDVEAGLTVRPWTEVRRRIEEIVYLEGIVSYSRCGTLLKGTSVDVRM